MTTFIEDCTRTILAHGRLWAVELPRTRVVIRDHGDRKMLGSWRMTRERRYQLYRDNRPLLVTDWLGESHPILAPNRDEAIARCEAITYYLMATAEFRSSLDSSMTELVLWSQRHKQLTRRTPNVVGDLGEFYAVKALGLARASEREAGFDAWSRDGRRIQIKCRRVRDGDNGLSILDGKTLPAVRRDAGWDCLVLVLVDNEFRLKSIHEMDRQNIDAEWPEGQETKRQGKLLLSVRRSRTRHMKCLGHVVTKCSAR